MAVPNCPKCLGAGVRVCPGGWVRTCRRCRGRGTARPRCPAARLHAYLFRHGLVPCVEDYTGADGVTRPLLTLWSADKIEPAGRVWRLVEKHFDGLTALLTGDALPAPGGVRAARAGLVDEGPLRRADA